MTAKSLKAKTSPKRATLAEEKAKREFEKLGKTKFRGIRLDAAQIVSEETWRGSTQSLWAAAALMRLNDKRLAKFVGDNGFETYKELLDAIQASREQFGYALELLEHAELRLLCAGSRSHDVLNSSVKK